MVINSRRRALLLLAVVALVGRGSFSLRALQANPEAPLITGMVRETEILIAPEISGRLATVYVRPGQQVKKGDLLALLSNPELTASVLESKAALGKTRADRDNVFAGVRKEMVDISAGNIRIAEAKLVLANQQYERSAALAKTLSRQNNRLMSVQPPSGSRSQPRTRARGIQPEQGRPDQGGKGNRPGKGRFG